jgi:hypothetical protein
MARAALTTAMAAAFLVSLAGGARAGELLDAPKVPPEFLGVMLRLPMGTFVGKNSDRVGSPESGYGISVQLRLAQGLYADLGYDQRIPVLGTPPKNGTLLGVGAEFAGLRKWVPTGPTSHLLFGAGVGGGTVNPFADSPGTSAAGPAAYVLGGFEHNVFAQTDSGSYVGLELAYNHFFVNKDAGFQGGLVEVRAAFSYYFGGDEARGCCF